MNESDPCGFVSFLHLPWTHKQIRHKKNTHTSQKERRGGRDTALHDLHNGTPKDFVRDRVGVSRIALRIPLALDQVHLVQACEDCLLFSTWTGN